MKKCLILLFLMFFTISVFAETQESRGYVGTPPGFYDDIDPNTLNNDEEEDFVPANHKETDIQNKKSTEINEYTPPQQAPATKNYADIYNSLEIPDFAYMHNIDPDQYYDTKDAAWSIYPLLRLNSAIYFKNIAVEPGYYLLTPREHKGKWYILFKQNGLVVHIIPVYERGYTPESFYDTHIPKPKLKKTQKIHMAILDTVGKTKSSKRKPPVKSYLEVNDLDNYFINIVIYYGGHKYSTLFRTIRL